ncbi:MAG: hypothetical protein ABSG80_10865 [Verrucomicrobiota bacterium]|jgi:uncharacterized membrane protein required for colicin V production
MNSYLSYALGLFIVAPVGALIAQYVIAWIAGFRPRYLKVLLSTIVAYAIVNIIGLVLSKLGGSQDQYRDFQVLAGLATLTCTHMNMIRSDAGKFIHPLKALVVANQF